MELKLYYRQFLLEQEKTAVGALFIRQVINYLATLGIGATEENALWYLHNLRDNLYCGHNLDPNTSNANFVMYHPVEGMYWFTNPYDAIMYVNHRNHIVKDCALQGYPQSERWSTYFDRYRGHTEKGFVWLYKDDLPFLDEILAMPKKIYCESRRLEFLCVEDAARWLTQVGKAANEGVALRQLQRHLNGQTGSCYGLVFKEY